MKFNNYNKKPNRLINIIIFTLFIILILLTYKIIKPIIKPKKSIVAYNSKAKAIQQTTNNKVNKWENKIEELKIKFTTDSSLIVLSGTTDISVTYTNKDTEGAGNKIGFLKRMINNLQEKSLKVNTTYNFGYSFDFSTLDIEHIGENKVKVILKQSNIKLKYIEETTENTILEHDYSLLSSKFTPQETSAIMNNIRIKLYNTLINNRNLRDEAIEKAIYNISNIVKSFGLECVEVEIFPDMLLENEDAEIVNVKY